MIPINHKKKPNKESSTEKVYEELRQKNEGQKFLLHFYLTYTGLYDIDFQLHSGLRIQVSFYLFCYFMTTLTYDIYEFSSNFKIRVQQMI